LTHYRSVRTGIAAVVVCILVTVCTVEGQEFQIGIIDLYGLSRVSADQVRQALTFKEGDTISLGGDERPAFLTASENRLALLPGVARAWAEIVCCDQGRAIVYVGIEETGATTMHFRAAPLGAERLAADIVQSGEEFSKAFMIAVQRGDTEEDRSEGHAFARDPATRAIQERFLLYAKARSARASPRLAEFFQRDPPCLGGASPGPFIEFLNSPVWSDRNKASGALVGLCA
jgi:hypothetical protein